MTEILDGFDQSEVEPCTICCTTFNILAPIYKRLNGGVRESEFRECWHSRNNNILEKLLHLNSSVFCLQEFWIGNEELVGMYERRLHDAGYVTYKLARTNNRGDGLLTALHKSKFRVLNYMKLSFNDVADRVAQILHVELCCDVSRTTPTRIKKEALIVNTHLIFPHDSRYCFLRLQQVYKILQHIRAYMDNLVLPIPVLLCGDWNGSKKGHVYKFLRSQGFVSSYDIAHRDEDDSEDAQKWISHRNHRGNICGVDFIWIQNPQKSQKPLKESFIEALLGNIKNLLGKVVTSGGVKMPEIFTEERSCITYSQFSQALAELGLSGHGGLADKDIKDIWEHIDASGDGTIDLQNFVRAWTLCSVFQHEDSDKMRPEDEGIARNSDATIGFVVNKATLFPSEAEQGMWPENYLLSDHAHLTVEFSIVASCSISKVDYSK